MPEQKLPTMHPLHLALVAGQFVFATWIVFTSGWPFAKFVPAALSVTGLLLAAWAVRSMGLRQLSTMPVPRSGSVLVAGGPYRWIRHPMYAGLILFCAGLILTRASLFRSCLLAALIGILVVKSREEEKELRQHVTGYADYRRWTKRFIPFVW